MEFVYFTVALLPVAYFSGWWLAGKQNSSNRDPKGFNLNTDYFKGLNYVLNEQPDKAIEIFIKMLEVDSETIETHLALGNLFRRRGEVDRAIRIHQNLIARPSLNRDQKAHALLELGMDYMRSGLLDRAEGLFKQLLDLGKYEIEASNYLLDIYQQEKDWEQAIVCARRLEAATGGRNNTVISQYYCELAENHIVAGNQKSARENLRKALNIDPRCVRASIIEARLLLEDGKFKSALNAYKRIEKQDPDYLPEVIEPILSCYRSLGQLDDAVEYLQQIADNYGGITPLLHLTELISELKGEEQGTRFISDALYKRPTIKGVDRLLEYTLKNTQGEIRAKLETIKELTSSLLARRPMYRCQKCGFDARLMHWQCPGCKCWTTIKPIQGTEGE